MSYDIGPRIGIEGEAAYRKSIRDINAATKSMTAEMKALASAYADGDQSEEKLRKQNQLLNRQIDMQMQKLLGLQEGLSAAKDKYGEADEKTQKWQRAVNEATAELNRLSQELTENTGALSRAEEANTEFAQAQRRAEEAAEQLRREQERLASQITQTSDKLNKSSEALNSVNKGALIATAALAALAVTSGKVGADFEAQMSKVEAISGASAEQMKALNDAAKEMGETTKFSASQSGKALEYMAMAGWKTDQMIGGLPGIMSLAAASGEDLALVSDIVTDALTGFKLQASDSAHFADVLARASSSANTNVSMMGETFKYVAPVAGALGYNVEDVAVAIGLMANAGIKGESAGTALRGILTNIAKPTAMTRKYIQELGVSLTDTTGEMKPLSELLTEMRGKFAGLSEAQKAQYAAGIAGKEAMSGMLALVNSSDADFSKLTKAIDNSNGAAKDMAETMEKNLKGQLTLLKSAAEGTGIAFYEKFEKQATGAVEKLAKKVGQFSRDLSSGELDDELKAVAATAAGAGTALVAFNAALAVKDLKNFATAVKVGGVAMEEYTAATKAGAIAQGALNLAQSISPMGWIAIAAGAAVTAFVAYKAMTHESTSETAVLNGEIKELNKELEEQVSQQNELAEARSDSLGDVNTEINLVSTYVEELHGLTDVNGKVIDGYEERAAFLSEQINNLIPNAVSATEDEAGAYYKVTDSIEKMLFAKKKEMALAAWETEYKDALKNRADALDKVREASEKQAEAEAEVSRLRQEAMTDTGREQEALEIKVFEAELTLRKATEATDEATSSWENYNKVVSGFNTALAADNMEQLNAAIAVFSSNLVKATGDNKAELEKAVVDAKTNLDLLVAHHAKGWEQMTEAERQEARNQVAELKALLDQQATEAKRGGVQLPENFGQGVTEGSPLFSAAMMELFNKSKNTVEAAGESLQDVGYGYDIFFKKGLESGAEEVKTAGQSVGQSAYDGANAKASEASRIGEFFTAGFAEGIKSKGPMGAVWNAAWEMARSAKKAAEKAGDVNSPSRVMKRVGKYYSEGFGIGITDGISYARKAAQKLGDAVISEIADLNDQLAKMQDKEREEQAVKDLAYHKKAIEKKYEELGKAEKKEKQKILDEIAKLQTDWNDKQVKAEKDAAKLALQEKIKTLEEFKKEYDSALSELERKQQSMADKLSGYGELFEKVKPEIGSEYLKLNDLQSDIDKIEEYGNALQELKERGISDSLLSEITSMNMDDAINYTSLLLKKTPEEYDKYMLLWEEKQKLSGEVAKQFYQDEFDHLQTEFVDKVPQELSKLKTEMQGIGKNSAIGLAEGFWSKKSYIVSTFKSVLEAALQEAKAAMEIHSPSRRWAEVGKFMADGLGVGFTGRMQTVAQQISNSIPVPSVDTSPIAKIVEGGVNGLASVVQGGSSAPIRIEVPVVMDGRELTRLVADYLPDEQRQRGVSRG